MKEKAYPRARHEGIVVRELDGEVLIYDLDGHEAHCLNKTAALVWKHCDGETTPGEISRRLEAHLGETVDEEIVWVGLEELWKLGLLEGEEPRRVNGMTRTQLVRRGAVAAAVAVPLVASIAAPTAAQAATCLPQGTACTFNEQCCSLSCANNVCA